MSNSLEIRQCILTNNDCYKQGKKIKPAGIVVHSTGANNPNLKRYVQPDDGTLGTNSYKNHWNNSGISKCVHAFIGKDKDGNVRVYQTLPWDYRCWGCGKGKNGSYNDSYIQFEICEDALTDANYFNKAFALAIELCAYLCKEYNISIENVISHHESYIRGYGSNHGDCDNWLKKFGKDMDWFRSQVSGKNSVTITNNVSTSTSSSSTTSVTTYEVQSGDTLSKIAAKTGVAWKTIAELNGIKFPYIIKKGQVLKLSKNSSSATTSTSFKVKLKSDLNIRKSPNGEIVKASGAKKNVVYTIIETDGNWGLLKSYQKNRNGWISISDKYVQRV